MYRIVGRHKNVKGAIITEAIDEEKGLVSFTATIRGWRNWRIYRGEYNKWRTRKDIMNLVIDKVREIEYRIDTGDEKVFHEDVRILKEA